jgi:hypothetical protein
MSTTIPRNIAPTFPLQQTPTDLEQQTAAVYSVIGSTASERADYLYLHSSVYRRELLAVGATTLALPAFAAGQMHSFVDVFAYDAPSSYNDFAVSISGIPANGALLTIRFNGGRRAIMPVAFEMQFPFANSGTYTWYYVAASSAWALVDSKPHGDALPSPQRRRYTTKAGVTTFIGVGTIISFSDYPATPIPGDVIAMSFAGSSERVTAPAGAAQEPVEYIAEILRDGIPVEFQTFRPQRLEGWPIPTNAVAQETWPISGQISWRVPNVSPGAVYSARLRVFCATPALNPYRGTDISAICTYTRGAKEI